MAVTVRIPTPLRKLTDNKSQIQIDGDTIEAILGNMESSYPGIKGAMYAALSIYILMKKIFVL